MPASRSSATSATRRSRRCGKKRRSKTGHRNTQKHTENEEAWLSSSACFRVLLWLILSGLYDRVAHCLDCRHACAALAPRGADVPQRHRAREGSHGECPRIAERTLYRHFRSEERRV